MQSGGVSNGTPTALPISTGEDGFAFVKLLEDPVTCEWNSTWGNDTDPLPHEPQPLNTLQLVSILLCLFNAAANGFSFAIFRNKAFNKSIMSVLLLGLSLFEVAFQLGQAGYVGANILRGCCIPPLRSRTLAIGVSAFAVVTRQMSGTFQLARNWTLAALSLYRYEAVCRSMSTVKLFKKENSYRILLTIGAMCTLVMLPRLFEACEIVCFYEATGQYVLSSALPYLPVIENQVYQLFYMSACLFILQSGGPTITVLICSAYVLKVLWARQRFRQTQNMRQSQSGTDKLIIMLALTFFVLEMPAFFTKLLYSAKAMSPATDLLMSNISNTMITLDSSLNIFIYLFSNPTFLQVTKQMLGCCRQCDEGSNGHSTAQTGGTILRQTAGGGGSREETLGASQPLDAARPEAPGATTAPGDGGQPPECQALMTAEACDDDEGVHDGTAAKEAEYDSCGIQWMQNHIELRVTEV